MKSTNWNTSLPGSRWTGTYMLVWIVGVALTGLYALKTIDDFRVEQVWLDCLAGLFVVALFATAQYVGRIRFLEHRTIKYFCMTAVTSVFLCLMDVTRFNLVPATAYPAIVAAYLVAMFFLSSRRDDLRKS